MKNALLAALLVSLVLTGCGSIGKELSYDHHEVRLKQAAETGRHIADHSEWERLKDYIEDRVVQIAPYEPKERFDRRSAALRGGRGCAVTRDGYFLTAYHVVDEGPFLLIETTGYSKLSPHRPYTSAELDVLLTHRNYPGRLVWSDRRLDLAVVKFDRPSPRVFTRMRTGVPEGSTLYSADDEGTLVYPRPTADRPLNARDILEGMIGNGPFAVAGRLKSVEPDSREPRAYNIATSLVARGGMSGGPLVTKDGELCGILLGYTKPIFPPGEATTRAAFLDPAFIESIIAADRRDQSRSAD